MKTVLDVPGMSLSDPGGRCRAPDEEQLAVPAHLAGETEPAARLVARRYRLRSLLGRGGMGRVWLAGDEVLHRPVALKQVLLNGLWSADLRGAAWACALREARAAARVDHIGAVRIHDIVGENGCPWIVMEPLSGRTLQEALNSSGPLTVDEVTRVGLSLLDVLQATHRAGIVHRDLKPGNVHLCADGRVVLTDYGIACTIDDATSGTGTFSGSPGYISPERLDGRASGPAADLFSLGATLFAAVEGRPPFDRGSLAATLAAVALDEPAPFLRAGPLRPVIEGLLGRDPDGRLSAGQARAALRDIHSEHGSGTRPGSARFQLAGSRRGRLRGRPRHAYARS
jgi:serine/threonine protein kinase